MLIIAGLFLSAAFAQDAADLKKVDFRELWGYSLKVTGPTGDITDSDGAKCGFKGAKPGKEIKLSKITCKESGSYDKDGQYVSDQVLIEADAGGKNTLSCSLKKKDQGCKSPYTLEDIEKIFGRGTFQIGNKIEKNLGAGTSSNCHKPSGLKPDLGTGKGLFIVLGKKATLQTIFDSTGKPRPLRFKSFPWKNELLSSSSDAFMDCKFVLKPGFVVNLKPAGSPGEFQILPECEKIPLSQVDVGPSGLSIKIAKHAALSEISCQPFLGNAPVADRTKALEFFKNVEVEKLLGMMPLIEGTVLTK